MIDDFLRYLGKTIKDSQLREFINNNDFTKVKKEQISVSSGDQSFWVQGKKNGASFLFTAEINNQDYPAVPAEREKNFIPRLEIINFELSRNKSTDYTFPLGLSFDLDFNEICKLLGDPTTVSSHISPSWLKDDGRESFYRWEKKYKKDVILSIEYRNCSRLV